jgi:hypothetical protein
MSGLMARIRRRRADESPPASVATDAEADVARPAPDGAEQPTAALPVTVPAGADPAEITDTRPGFRERARMRRRLRYLRRIRELGFRDVGGLVFDLDRFGRSREDLVRAKLDAVRAVDTELRALETALDDARPLHELHEAGVAACPRCGGLHGSEASFCPTCGLHLSGPRTVGDVAGPAVTAAVAPAETESPPAIESASGATSGALTTATNGSGPTHDEADEPARDSQATDPAR